MIRVGHNHICTVCIRYIFGREITIYTVIYGVNMRLWPSLYMISSMDKRFVGCLQLILLPLPALSAHPCWVGETAAG